MASLVTEQVTSSGLEATANAAAEGGDTVRPGSILRVTNGSGESVTVTMDNPETRDGDLAVPDRTVAVPAGESRYVYASDYYRSRSTQRVGITYSAHEDVTVEVIQA